MKVIVGSKSQVKLEAAQEALRRSFPGEEIECEGIAVASGVPDQPMTDRETLTGVLNRVAAAREAVPDADLWMAFEGGVEEGEDGVITAFAWAAVTDGKGTVGRSRATTYLLPEALAAHIRAGKELGEADDIVFGRTGSKHTTGSVGLLTHDAVTRAHYYADAAVMALIPFKNPHLYG